MKNRTLIFESGERTDFTYSAEDLKGIAEGYSELKYSAPWTFGHNPESGSPAAGWVRSLDVEVGDDGVARLYANSDFNKVGEEAIKTGTYENKSISLYTPDSPFNPNKGKWSIRHVAMLGGEPPAIKSLGPIIEEIQYAEQDTEFVSYGCSCNDKKAPTTINLKEDMNAMTEIKKLDKATEETEYSVTDAEKIAALEAELAAIKAAQVQEIEEEIIKEEEMTQESMSEVDLLKQRLSELTAELSEVKEANTALTVSSAVSPYYSEGIITEDVLPESTLTRVVTKLSLGLTNYSENETPLDVIEALLTALNQASPTVEYGETWTEPAQETTVVKTASYSNGDEMHELAVATAQKYTLSYGKALSAIVKAKEVSEAKTADFSETLNLIINPASK